MYANLRKIITERNLSGAKLSRMADVSQSDFYMMMSGKKPAFPNWRKRIAEALQMPEVEVFPEHNVKEG